MTTYPKRLIEVDLPIARISAHARREKSIRHGHISTLHIWWARRPLAACRAVILASLWPDPVDLAAWPSIDHVIKPARFLDEARARMKRWAQVALNKISAVSATRLVKVQHSAALLDDPGFLREVLLDFIADFADWDHSTDADYLATARALTQAAHEALGGEARTRSMVIDPFAGGGSIPLEALRVGADAFASDLNPIPVLLNKVVLEYIPRFGQRLADEVRAWGTWIKAQADEELAQFYPADKDGCTPIAYLWARTILSEAPGQGDIPVEVPLMRSLWLAKKSGRTRALRWVRDDKGKIKTQTVEVTYVIDGQPTPTRVKRPLLEIFEPKMDTEVEGGTVARGSATCPVTGFTTKVDRVRAQLKKRRGGAADARLFCVVTTKPTEQGRFYRLPARADLEAFEAAARELERRERADGTERSRAGRAAGHRSAKAATDKENRRSLVPDEALDIRGIRRQPVRIYGMERWGDLFSPRQALALSTLSRLVREAGERMLRGQSAQLALARADAAARQVAHTSARTGRRTIHPRADAAHGGAGAAAAVAGISAAETQTTLAGDLSTCTGEPADAAFSSGLAEAVATCLAMPLGKLADFGNACTRWGTDDQGVTACFSRQAIVMVWDFAESSPVCSPNWSWDWALRMVCGTIDYVAASAETEGHSEAASATAHPLPDNVAAAVVTDPPYYDAILYAYLSDFFYVWLRRTLADVHPALFSEDGVPKDEEIVVDPPHQLSHSTKDISFYERELQRALAESRRVVRPDGVGCIVFASKSTASWEAILKATIDAGWIVTGSWPIDTEMVNRVSAQGQARLGSSVHIVVRPRESSSGKVVTGDIGEWREVLEELPKRIEQWMPRLADEGVVGADAIFACLGPALEIYSRYSRVERADGTPVTLREYLEHVWATVSTEALSLIFKDADAGGLEPDARLTAMWLWTIGGKKTANGENDASAEEQGDENDEGGVPAKPTRGFALEFDAARKIAQGLGVHLEKCESFVEVKGKTARLLSVPERTRHLFGKDAAPETGRAETSRKGKKKAAPTLFQNLEQVKAEIETAEAEAAGKLAAAKPGATVLDRVHQAMLLFSTGRGEALRRFVVDDGIGKDARFWKLADSLSKLYPANSGEKRWVDGVLARKKSFGV